MMYEAMEFFVGWKFGVPVRVFKKDILKVGKKRIFKSDHVRLIHEDKTWFTIIGEYNTITVLPKDDYLYLPIFYSVDLADSPLTPQFPVCSNRRDTAYCNRDRDIDKMDVEPTAQVWRMK